MDTLVYVFALSLLAGVVLAIDGWWIGSRAVLGIGLWIIPVSSVLQLINLFYGIESRELSISFLFSGIVLIASVFGAIYGTLGALYASLPEN